MSFGDKTASWPAQGSPIFSSVDRTGYLVPDCVLPQHGRLWLGSGCPAANAMAPLPLPTYEHQVPVVPLKLDLPSDKPWLSSDILGSWGRVACLPCPFASTSGSDPKAVGRSKLLDRNMNGGEGMASSRAARCSDG